MNKIQNKVKKLRTIDVDEFLSLEFNTLKDKTRDVTKLKNAIIKNGFSFPVFIWAGHKYVIDGTGRKKAVMELKEEGYQFDGIPVVDIEADTLEEAKQKTLEASSQFGDITRDSFIKFADDLEVDFDTFEIKGIDSDLLIEPEEKDDEVPESPVETKSKLGDLYELGEHRVLCGDSTKIEDVDLLFGDNKAKVIFTSPPYNMNGEMYENYEDNLERDEYIDFNLNVFNNWKRKLNGFVFWNISYNKNARDEFIEILYRIVKETGLKFLELIVWNKKTAMPVISKEAMTRQYEDILVVGNDEKIKEDLEMGAILRNTKDSFFNTKTRKWLRNYWEISPIGSQLDNHKACFPVELPLRAIQVMSVEGEIISDPFLGTGSTLIASEKINRKCYGIELDPRYVDVIVQRYVDYTGNENIKLNGQEIVWKKTQN